MLLRSFLSVLIIMMSSSSLGQSLTWNLVGVQFTDGSTASGSFEYNASTNAVSNVQIVTSSGIYTSTTSFFSVKPFEFVFVPTGSLSYGAKLPALVLLPSQNLTNAGGSVSLCCSNGSSFEGLICDDACDGVTTTHQIDSGVLSAGNAPAGSVLYMFTGTTDTGLAEQFSYSSPTFITSVTSIPASALTNCSPAAQCSGGVIFNPVFTQVTTSGPEANATIFFGVNQSAYYFSLGAFGQAGTYQNALPGFTQTGTLTVQVSGTLPPPPNIGSAQNSTDHQVSIAEPVSTGNGNYYYPHMDFTVAGRGMPLVFQRSYNTLDNYAGPLGANWTHSLNIILTLTSSGVATIRWGDGHGETYTPTGSTFVPQAGVFSTLVANADGTFTLTQKNQTTYFFSVAGKLTAIQDKNGNSVQLAYDGSGNLVAVTASGGRTLALAYDGSGRIVSVTDPMGRAESYTYDNANNLATATDPLQGVTTYAYDANHCVTSITLPNGNTLLQNTYDAQGRVISQTNGRGLTWQFAYNTPAAGQTTITDARGSTTVHAYDSALRIVGIMDSLGHTTSYTYDANNDRTSVTNQNGNTTSFSFDTNGNVTGITDPLSNSTAFTYDLKNDLLSVTNPKHKTTAFSYDASGNLTRIQDALGDETGFSYDSSGEITAKTDAVGNSTQFTYSGAGDLAGIKDGLGNSSTLSYDGDGRLVSVKDPNQHTATAVYDMLGRLTKTSDPLGDQTALAYDAIGQVLSVTDANGHITAYTYDAANNLVTVTDALGHVTKYAYDPDNNRTTFTNAKGNATTYQYDAVNRLVGTVDPLGDATAYSYDPVGNAVAVIDAKGQTNDFTYDVLNRLIAMTYSDGTNVGYVFDSDGNRTSLIDPHGTTTYRYDDADRLVMVTNPGGQTVSYVYDPAGNRTGLTYPAGTSLGYQYDAANRLSKVTDWISRQTTYAYDPAGNLAKISYPTGASVVFSYDNANRLLSANNAAITGNFSATSYTLDAAGNRVAISANGLIRKYGYDALNELISQMQGSQVTTWIYDEVGNRISQIAPTGTAAYAYDAADRLLSAGASTFSYDADGNRISQTAGTGTTTYSYDASNRLAAVVGPGTNNSFAYDGDGNRVGQIAAGFGSYNYINDTAVGLPVVLNEQGPDGSINFAYGLSPIELASSGFNYFYGFDGLGSVVALTDGTTGKATTAYAYDAWGNATSNGSVGQKNKLRFTGEALDPGTGLYYLRARYYDSSSGTFLSRDLFPGFAAQPQTRNRYRYSLDDPIRYTDPSGFSAIENSNQTASVVTACGTNCERIWGAIVDAVTSGAGVIAKALQDGWSSSTSIGGTDAGNTVVQTGAAIVINPDTVSAEINTIKGQQALIQSAAGLLGPNYSKSDLDESFGYMCANSYAGGVCLRGESYVEGLIMKDATQQGDLPGFQ
jgi:RHS repeat-associated protein